MAQSFTARVCAQGGHLYKVTSGNGTKLAVPSGRLTHLGLKDPLALPAVGDLVACLAEPGDGRAVIREVQPRASCFVRKRAGSRSAVQVIAANVTTCFLVTAPGGDFSVRRLERYLVQTREAGADGVVLINKVDLAGVVAAPIDMADLGEEVAALAAEAGVLGVPVHAVSALTGAGLASLAPYLGPGAIAALLGSSGVGKTTLANALLGREDLRTAAVREKDAKGRHTTTDRRLLPLDTGGYLLDTPGMRELGLWADDGSVDQAFQDIADLAARCRFRDCRHMTEPGCAVAGKVDPDRVRSYRKLRQEARRR